MARPVSPRVESLRRELRQRLSAGAAPGDRFFSNRELARHARVSYQTASRLLDELVHAGWLRRLHGSGTYVAGDTSRARIAYLVFHPRGLRPESFGARLHAALRAALDDARIPHRELWAIRPPPLPDDAYPVFWETYPARGSPLPKGRFALVLNDRPPPGLGARFIDSVQVDDFSGGCAAAELLRGRIGLRGAIILAGPRGDPRSDARVAGYRTIFPAAPVFHARSWYREGAEVAARRILVRKPLGVLCANDRLAEAVARAALQAGPDRPHLIGFDDAPVATELHLTTIAIPWDELVASATRIIAARLRADSHPAKQLILQPHAVTRS
ncbi:MAG: substrate-binding domain-containing protein [Verrucomicrobiae bacterium]|nr:substrate-binding domain-containing protein [Verrucomicrobiae bacterium]